MATGEVLDDDVWRYLPLGPATTLIVGVVGLGQFIAVTPALAAPLAERGAGVQSLRRRSKARRRALPAYVPYPAAPPIRAP